MDGLHKVLADEEATCGEVRTAAYPSIWQWVVLGVAIGVTEGCSLTSTPFCLKSMTPFRHTAMSTTVPELSIQFPFK